MSENAKKPRIRFKGFTDAWEQRKLKDMSSLITKQTGFDYSETIKPALTNEKSNNVLPFIQNKDFEGENINLITDFYIPIEVANRFPRITIDKPSLLVSISGKIGNIGFGGNGRMHAGLDSIVFRRQAERVKTHRIQNVKALHSLFAGNNVQSGV